MDLDLPCENEVELVKSRMVDVRPEMPGIPDEWVRSFLTEGKFVRSRLLFLCYYASGGTEVDQDVVDAAASIELIHCASLVHDDILDDAETRRGLVSAPVMIGDPLSILFGDALFTESFWLGSRLGPEVATLAREGVQDMVVGEARELTSEDDRWDPEDAEQVAREKTASMMGSACATGGVLAGTSEEIVGRLKRFGVLVGLAFQAVDDVLDLTGSSNATGKPPGIDERVGAPNLARALGKEGAQEAQEIAAARVDEAIEEIEPLPEGEAKRRLGSLATFISSRER